MDKIVKVLKKIKLRNLIILVILLVFNTYAWFIYATRVSLDLSAHISSWNVEFVSGSEEITTNIEIVLDRIYPGMENFERTIEVHNKGETPAILTYEIQSLKIMDEIFEVSEDTGLTSDELENKIETEYPMPFFDKVPPAAAIKDMSKTKVAFVTSGGIVPVGNPDRIESSSATKYGIYSIKDKKSMDKKDFMTIHGGYDRAFVLENPNLVIPLDVMREIEAEGGIGELADYFVTTTGTGTSTGNAKRFGEEFVKKLLADGVQAVILTST